MQVALKQQCVCLRATAAFAFLWVVARAAVQAITIDEADTFLAYVAPGDPTHWSASANNQLLNSLLMRLFTSIFGAWHLALRAALIGAAIYICAAYALVRSLAANTKIEWPLFVCLTFNPFLMDYFVAARGYSLALGLWMAVLALAMWEGPLTPARCAVASVCAGLSFAANFSFVFAAGFVMLLLLARACRHGKRYEIIFTCCLLPGLTVALLLTGSLLASWPKGQFVYGASSLGEMARGILACSLYEINSNLVNLPLRAVLEAFGPWIFGLLGIAALPLISRRATWAAALSAVVAATLGAHWWLHRYLGVLLPKDRTALYFAPLLFLIVGALIAAPARPALRMPAIVLLYLSAGYFVCCLRLSYFREWEFNADMKQVYSVLAYYNRSFGVRDIFPEWRYVASLNFYRMRSAGESLPPFESRFPPYPANRAVYVLYFPNDEAFINEHGLKIVYYGRQSLVAVAIRPEVESPPAAAASCSGEPRVPI